MIDLPIETLLAGFVAVLGAIYGYTQNKTLKNALKITQSFAEEGAEYLRIKADGTITVAEKESLGEAAIKFFESIEEATGYAVINSPAVPWIKPAAIEIASLSPVTLEGYAEAIPDGEPLPAKRSRKMSPSRLANVLCGHEPLDQISIKRQILAAESQNLAHYYVKWSGGVYMIYFGVAYGTSLKDAYTDIPIVPAPNPEGVF